MVNAERPAGDAGVVIDRLAAHWTEGIARELVHRLVVSLECPRPAEMAVDEFGVQFALDLSRIYLGGLGERVGCLVAGGRGEEPARRAVSRLWQEFGAVGGVVVAFCTSDGAYAQAVRRLPPRFSLVLAPGDVADLLASPQPQRRLAERFATRLGRTFMSVYDISKPATVAFFGRARELERLAEDAATSYAVTGPGRIGKSSLLKRYVDGLRRRSDPRAARLVAIDCTDLRLGDPNAVGAKIAADHPSPRSQRVSASGLMTFLRECRPPGGPVELLIDEADEFCSAEPFRQIGQAAREGSVRLVVCGRKGVHDFALREPSPLARRLDLIRLGPLNDAEARDLIVLPMADLGIAIDEDPGVVRRVLDRSGRLPHLIQYYCKHIVNRVAAGDRVGPSGVTHAMLSSVEQEYDFLEHVVNPLLELRDRRTYEVAFGLLGEGQDYFRLADIEAIGFRLGHPLSPREAKDLCDELVVQNVLVWDKSAYRVSSPVLRMAALRSGLLR